MDRPCNASHSSAGGYSGNGSNEIAARTLAHTDSPLARAIMAQKPLPAGVCRCQGIPLGAEGKRLSTKPSTIFRDHRRHDAEVGDTQAALKRSPFRHG
jgi:hypothetical protein